MQQIEDIIRDKLSVNLDLFQMNLSLIKKEFFIPQINTTRSFIDILAQDNENNYVIIEVKRSNQSSREAIHEIYKYTEAIIDKFKVTPGEVKSIIVSTEWKELFVPFSAFANESKNTILGFELAVQKDFSISALTIVKPCKTKNGRLFSPIHTCNLYLNDENLIKGIESHIEIYKQKNLNDFVLVLLKGAPYDNEKYKSDLEEMLAQMLGEDKSQFKGNFDNMDELPYMIYSAFQRLESNEYLDVLKREENEYKETVDYISDVTDEDEILSILENNVIGNIKPWFYSDHCEIGYPAKFATKILEEEQWEILKIIRSDSLELNNLLTDDKIISELKGETGISNVKLYDSCSLDHIAKLNEIKDRSYNCLKYNIVWQNDIDSYFKKIPLNIKGNLNISIFSPHNILLTITYMSTDEEPRKWLPNYVLEVETENVNNVYIGTFHWSGKTPNFKYIVEKYYDNDPVNILNPMIWGGHEDRNTEIMEDLGLSYESYLIENPKTLKKVFHYSRYAFIEKDKVKNGLIELIQNSDEFVSKLVWIYKTFHHKAKIDIKK
jgi:hypothetical protein